eukprot:3422933-Rhodomonas_salina.1
MADCCCQEWLTCGAAPSSAQPQALDQPSATHTPSLSAPLALASPHSFRTQDSISGTHDTDL